MRTIPQIHRGRWPGLVLVSALLVSNSIVSPSAASAQARYVKVDQVAAGDARAIEVSATDSDVVSVKVLGGKYPLVAQSSSDNARHWAAETDAAAHTKGGSAAHERHEFGHLSDILLYQRVESGGRVRDVVAIDVGPQNLTMYEYDIPTSTLEQLASSMRRAATATDSLSRLRTSRSPSSSARESRAAPAVQAGNVAMSAAERCSQASAMRPIEYSAYPAGTNLERIVQPPLQTGSPVPAYPQSAIGARVTGEVPARFVIDSAGRPDVDTFRLRGVANPLFVRSVCDVLSRMRFAPSHVQGRPARQLVDETFTVAPPASTR
ncbi:MAG: energy transducer TonB [Gemmatimonadaceae bacterium]